MRKFSQLTEREILALAISAEEDDGRIYSDFAYNLKTDYPDTSNIFGKMADEENCHRRDLIDLYTRRFGEHIPLIRRQDISDFVRRKPAWQAQTKGIKTVRHYARQMEMDAARFYLLASQRTTDAATRKLLGDLAEAETRHKQMALQMEQDSLTISRQLDEDILAKRRFILQIIQPGLVGLMDGSVSTLAPVFAAAFATKDPYSAFLVGLAASIGAGISMGFAEALSDDGKLSGRGHPWLRGLICGVMTTCGGIGHTLPFLIRPFSLAFTFAVIMVIMELLFISWIRWKYEEIPLWSSALQIMVGGSLVFATGILIGSS